MSERHLPSLTLSAIGLGSLPADQLAQAQAHLATCERCRNLQSEMTADRERFSQSVLPRTLPALAERQRRRRFWSWTAGIPWRPLVAVMSVVAVVVIGRAAVHPAAPDYAIKGAESFQVFAKRGIEVFAVHDGTALAPGDQLRFAVDPGKGGYVLVASLDGAGHASIYYPFAGTESGPVTPESRSELPGAVTLDATTGEEHLFALFSAEPVPAGLVLERLEHDHPSRLGLPMTDELDLTFHKQAH